MNNHSSLVRITVFIVSLLGATALGTNEAEARQSITAPKVTVDSILNTLSLRQKIGQLVMPWLLGSYTAIQADAFDSAAHWVDTYGVGGIIISTGSPMDAAAKLNALQMRSRVPLLVAADLENGAGMRMAGATAFPHPMAIGATGRELDAYQLGRITALEARAIGIHWTFSPVADLNSNPSNPIINTRSFGESPDEINRLLTAYVEGASDHGLYTTAKHFPGHGDTGNDSHIDLPVLDACWDRLDSLELSPFRAAIRAGVTSVMTAHIAMRCLDGQDAPPATLSPHIMTDILRDSLGFRGITVTDALTMAAVVRKYGPGETAVRAFLAGSDLLLMPANIDAAVNAMLTAVAEGRITLDRIDQSVRRMLELKFGAGVFAKRTVALDSIPLVVGQRAHQKVADDIAERALTLVQRGGIDDFRSQNGRITVIAYAEVANRRMGNDMAKALRDHGNSVSTFRLYPSSGPMSYDSAQTLIERNGRVVFATSVRPISGRGHIDLPEALANLITETDGRKPTILVSFGSPYLLDQLERYDDAYLLAWNPVEATEKAAAAVVAGHAATIGRLPITLSETHPRGHGVILFPR